MPTKDNRRYPKRPMVGVGAILIRGDRILMARRGKIPMKGWWSLPGGALETGELLEDGIRREVREETGLEVKPVGMFQIFERIMRDSAGAVEYHYVLVAWVRRRDLAALEITEGTLGVIESAFRKRRPKRA